MAGKLFQRTQTLLQQKQKLSTPEGNSEDLIDCYLMTFFYLFIYLFWLSIMWCRQFNLGPSNGNLVVIAE